MIDTVLTIMPTVIPELLINTKSQMRVLHVQNWSCLIADFNFGPYLLWDFTESSCEQILLRPDFGNVCCSKPYCKVI